MLKAKAVIKTDKASRYLQALCGHFDRKVSAAWSESKGEIDFGFGHCQMSADEQSLVIGIESPTDDEFNRLKYVVSDHLERFAIKDGLKAEWKVVA